MSKKISLQTTCRLCASKKLTDIISLGDQYLSDFVKDNSKPPRYPLTLVLCQNCTLMQLKNTTPQSALYTEHYGYKSGINQTMHNELKDIAQKNVVKYGGNQKKLVVLDIGANDGTLLGYYPKQYERIGVEPIKKLAKQCKEHADVVVNDFFNFESANKVLKDRKVDIVSAISCFYDMEEPNVFLADVKNIMHKDSIFVIQQNYLLKMLTQNAFDNIVHEHLEYYSLLSLQKLLARHNLEVFDLELRELNGGSFRTYIALKNTRQISNSVLEQTELEKMINLKRKKVYTDFAKRIDAAKKATYNFIAAEVKAGKKVYVYGASTRGNTLLQYFGLNSKLVAKAVERNPEKWGKKIASVGIPIISEEQARKEKPDYMLVLPWFFKEEFVSREKDYLKNGGTFIFPLPSFDLVRSTT